MDPRLDELARRLTDGAGAVTAEGLWGSCAPILAAVVAERLERPLLLITAHADEADDCRDDIEAAAATAPDLLPQLDLMPSETVGSDELAGERMRLCIKLLSQAKGHAHDGMTHIVAPVLALMQPVPTADAIEARSLTIDVGLTLEPEALSEWLGMHGFTRCDAVDAPGDFARRGGIVDVYSNAHTDPVRIEFFGDEVESIRLVDLGTQRSTHTLHSVQIPALVMPGEREKDHGRFEKRPCHPAKRSCQPAHDTGSFLSLLPKGTIIAFHDPSEIQELGRTYWERLGEPIGMMPVDAVFRRAGDFTQLHLQRFGGVTDDTVRFDVRDLPHFEPKPVEALEALRDLAQNNDVIVLCDNFAEEKRLVELLSETPGGTPQGGTHEGGTHEGGTAVSAVRPERLRTAVGVIHRGFIWNSTAFVPHHELFHRYRQRRTLRRVQPARPIDSFFDLDTGDLVVHSLHGIGRFLGLKTIERGGRRDEYLTIEFADKAVVHVPTSQIHVVQKYIGTFRGKPRLSKLGGSAWKKTKARVAEAVVDLAAEMLAIQARRETEPGISYPHDTTWQREFEGSFLYTETEDQLSALADLKLDMNRPRPMDRLLCGDVGYGKTELAVRATFKTVEYGKQVAVLVPTTVLAAQHFQTFSERLADYPFTIEVLSRFRTKKEQANIVEQARKGRIDVLIGTHRLLSGDVRFADLGLVVIDEEQRFGVEAKERLKRLRATVDVLTLSATPIPRTLHMALLGIRDISSLATPPLDRRSIVTQVRMWEDELVREAILRELNRDGQVYFVHNFVRDIHNVANRLRTLVPEAQFRGRPRPDERRTNWKTSCSASSPARPTCSSRRTSSNQASIYPRRTRSSSIVPNVSAWPTCTSFAAAWADQSTARTPTCCSRPSTRSKTSRPAD